MAESMNPTMTPEERAYSADWARQRLQQLKSSRRPSAKNDYGAALNAMTADQRSRYASAIGDPMRQRVNTVLEKLPEPIRRGVQGVTDRVQDEFEDMNTSAAETGAAFSSLSGRGELANVAANRSARAGLLRTLRSASKGMNSPEVQADVAAAASAAAEQAWGRLWDIGQGALNGLASAFAGVLNIILIVPIVVIFLARLLGQMSFKVGFRGVRVHLIAPYSAATLPTIAWATLINVGWAIVWFSLLAILAYMYIEAVDKVCWASWIVNIFRPGFCPSS